MAMKSNVEQQEVADLQIGSELVTIVNLAGQQYHLPKGFTTLELHSFVSILQRLRRVKSDGYGSSEKWRALSPEASVGPEISLDYVPEYRVELEWQSPTVEQKPAAASDEDPAF